MYKRKKIIALVPAYNEEAKIGNVVERMPRDVVDCVLVINDGSTDGTAQVAEKKGALVLHSPVHRGIGAALRMGIEHALGNRYDIIVFVAGNNKDEPKQIVDLVRPIVDENFDIVMGSRYLPGGHAGNMPAYRHLATMLHPLIFSIFAGKRLTESTNGFRAFKAQMVLDKRINISQKWLDEYELEPYLLFKAIKLGYSHTEVPVIKKYPAKELGYTKMKPLIGWWSILRPILLLGLGIKE